MCRYKGKGNKVQMLDFQKILTFGLRRLSEEEEDSINILIFWVNPF
jgi:hypothetical protein